MQNSQYAFLRVRALLPLFQVAEHILLLVSVILLVLIIIFFSLKVIHQGKEIG